MSITENRELLDSEKLKLLADWFDARDAALGNYGKTEIQDDLRRIAKDLEEDERRHRYYLYADAREQLSTRTVNCLINASLMPDHCRNIKEVREYFKRCIDEGVIKVCSSGSKGHIKNFGYKSFKELEEWCNKE